MSGSKADTVGVPAAAEAVQSGPGVSVWSAIRRSPTWSDAIAPTILLRVVLLVFGLLAVIMFRPDALTGNYTDLWNRWDAPNFIQIARYGYGPPADEARIVLLPLFPLLIRVLMPFAEPATGGMVIAFVATLAAAAGIYRLALFDQSREAARWAVIAMSIFPTAYALVAPYSEALFLAFAIWAFVCARRDDWRGAGILTFLAALTRIQGAFLIPALVVEYWLARRRIDRDAGWVLLALAAPLLYLGINYATFGDPLFFLEIQRRFFIVTTVPPWVAIPATIDNALKFNPTDRWVTVQLAPAVALVLAAALTVWAAMGRGSRPSYFVYAALTLATFATLSWPISTPRYILDAFPIFLAAGALASRPSIGPPLLVASTLLMGSLMTLFVIGHWAF